MYLHPNPRNDLPYVTGEAVNKEKFILDSFHFNWSQSEYNGSEHSINNVKRSAEVCFNTVVLRRMVKLEVLA